MKILKWFSNIKNKRSEKKSERNMQPKLLLVDDKDKFKGYASYSDCHAGEGKRHRAFVTLLFDSENRVFLQKSRHKLFDGLWDFTAISHPLRINGKTESYQEASDRALKKEMGINQVQVRKIGAFNYFAKDGRNCEREYCAVLTGEFNGKFTPNSREVYEAKWVKFDELILGIKANPRKYTPWAQKASTIISDANRSGFKNELEEFTKDLAKFS